MRLFISSAFFFLALSTAIGQVFKLSLIWRMLSPITTFFGDEIHEVEITGLLLATTYYYQAVTGSLTSEIIQFKTSPLASAELAFNFVAMSDMQKEGGNPTIFSVIVNDGVIPTANTAQSNLFLGKIKELKFPLPPLKEQNVIGIKVNSLMALWDELEQHITTNHKQVEQLMQSCLKEVFETI